MNVSSTIREILTGDLQGSVLGPLLFLFYINDFHSSVKYGSVYHFADDATKILSRSSLEIYNKIQSRLLLNMSLHAHITNESP